MADRILFFIVITLICLIILVLMTIRYLLPIKSLNDILLKYYYLPSLTFSLLLYLIIFLSFMLYEPVFAYISLLIFFIWFFILTLDVTMPIKKNLTKITGAQSNIKFKYGRYGGWYRYFKIETDSNKKYNFKDKTSLIVKDAPPSYDNVLQSSVGKQTAIYTTAITNKLILLTGIESYNINLIFTSLGPLYKDNYPYLYQNCIVLKSKNKSEFLPENLVAYFK